MQPQNTFQIQSVWVRVERGGGAAGQQAGLVKERQRKRRERGEKEERKRRERGEKEERKRRERGEKEVQRYRADNKNPGQTAG